MKLKLIIVALASLYSLTFAQEDCQKYKSEDLLKDQKLLTSKVEQIKQYLEGREVIGFSPLIVFGSDFNISQTKSRIEKNIRIINQLEGFESLVARDCAKSILTQGQFDSYKNLLIEFTTHKNSV